MRSREMPSGTDGGRKQPTRRPPSTQAARAASATCGDGIGTESTAPAGSSVTPSARPSRGVRRCTSAASAGLLAQHPQGRQRGAGRGGREAGVEDERPGGVDQVLDERGGAEHRAALGAERLRQGRGDHHVAAARRGRPRRPGPRRPRRARPRPCASSTTSSAPCARAGRGELEPAARRRRARSRPTRPAPAPAVSGRRPAPLDRGHVVVRRPRPRGARRAARRRPARRGCGRRRRSGASRSTSAVTTREVGVVAGREHQRGRPARGTPASSRSSSSCRARVPVTRREAPAPAPQAPRRGRGGPDLRVRREAEVVVAGQVEQRGPPSAAAAGPAARTSPAALACGRRRPASQSLPGAGHAHLAAACERRADAWRGRRRR